MNRQKNPPFLQQIITLFTKYPLPIIIIIAALTIFFGYHATKLQIDANIFAFSSNAPEPQDVTTPETPPAKSLSLKGIKNNAQYPERGEVVPFEHIAINNSAVVDTTPIANYTEKEIIVPDYEVDKSNLNYYDGYVIIFSSASMFDPEVLNSIYKVRENLNKRIEIGSCLSPFDYITVEKKGTRLSIVPIAPVKAGETWTEETAQLFKTRLLNDKIAKNYLYTADGSTIMMYYRADNITNQSIEELDAIINPLRQYGKIALNGGGMISLAVMNYLNKDLITLIGLSLLVMLITYFIFFRSIRSMLIPASMSFVGIIWTFGLMALTGYKLTIITLLTPCLVLTLGSSYSVHMLSEYFDAISKNEKDKLPAHYFRISKTIFFSMATTVSGFLSLLICRTPLFKEFGITISFGVVVCAFLAIVYLPAILSITRNPRQKQISNYKNSKFAKFIAVLSDFIIKYWYVFIIIFVLLFFGFLFAKDKIVFDSNYMSYLDPNEQIVKDSLYFARTLGGTDPYYITINAPEGSSNFFLKSENLKLIYAYEAAIASACPDIVQILSFSQYVSFLNEVYSSETGIPDNNGLLNLLARTLKLIQKQLDTDVLNVLLSEDGNSVTLSMRNFDSVEQDLQTTSSARRLETTLDYYRYMLPEGTSSVIWSGASDGVRAVDMIVEDQNKATLLSMVLIIIIASIALLSVKFGISTIFPVLVGIMINYIFMYFTRIPFDIVTIGFSAITIGAGVDDALHFNIRYRQLMKTNPNLSAIELVRNNLNQTGRPIILTTLSVDFGLMMLLFASFTPIRYFGILMCVSLTSAMIATLFLLPALLILEDKIKHLFKKKLL